MVNRNITSTVYDELRPLALLPRGRFVVAGGGNEGTNLTLSNYSVWIGDF
jgi:hypothetical protein